MTKEIESCVLSKETFTNAGRDFYKKLNTIKKIIKEGRWLPPTQHAEKEDRDKKITVEKCNRELLEAQLDLKHWEKQLEFVKNTDIESNFSEFRNLAKTKYEKLITAYSEVGVI